MEETACGSCCWETNWSWLNCDGETERKLLGVCRGCLNAWFKLGTRYTRTGTDGWVGARHEVCWTGIRVNKIGLSFEWQLDNRSGVRWNEICIFCKRMSFGAIIVLEKMHCWILAASLRKNRRYACRQGAKWVNTSDNGCRLTRTKSDCWSSGDFHNWRELACGRGKSKTCCLIHSLRRLLLWRTQWMWYRWEVSIFVTEVLLKLAAGDTDASGW